MPTLTRSKSWAKTNQDRRLKLLNEVCRTLYYTVSTAPNKKMPYGEVAKVVRSLKEDNPWINRNVINFAFKKYMNQKKEEESSGALDATSSTKTVSTDTTKSTNTNTVIIGRPKGVTNLKKQHEREVVIAAKNEITQSYLEMKKKCSEQGEKIPDGWLKKEVKSVCSKRGIPEYVEKISLSTIRSRTKAIILQGGGSETLMASVEPHLVELICAMASIRRCLSTSECIALANDLIAGTELESTIIEWKRKRMEYFEGSPVLGKKYWVLFRKRWAHKLVTKRGQKFAMDRSNALTYSNVKKMYDEVYDCMVDAGVAQCFDQPSSLDHKQLKTRYHLTHPQMCLVVDEVGSNILQRGDGHIGGQKYVCEIGTVPQNKVSHNDRHFTVLGFTALDGSPVLCVIIIAGVKQMYEVETGLDMDAAIAGNENDSDFFEKNRGKGKLYPMGPECIFRGKTIPCLVRWSPSGSITSQILRDALQTLDYHGIFDRSTGRMPFLLLDGHGSRFELPFLTYITNPDHPWKVCIGVPYGTSLWQVADSKEQNGSFKIALSKIKKELLSKRLNLMMNKPTLLPTDIVPIVNFAWDRSFTRIGLNKKAIADRGWNPLNYQLLMDKSIKATMTESESKSFASMLKGNGVDDDRSDSMDHHSTINLTVSEISDITADSVEMNYDSKYLQRIPNTVTVASKLLNFESGRSALVAQTLLHEADLLKAREANKLKVRKGKETQEKLDKAKKLTAMLNFNHISCEVGKDSLELRLKMAEKKKAEEMEVMNRRNKKVSDRKQKFDAIMSKIESNDLPLEKLSAAQLKILCGHTKRDTDNVCISKLKRNELLSLWISWKDRNEIPTSLTSQLEVGSDAVAGYDKIMTNVETPECNADALNVTIV